MINYDEVIAFLERENPDTTVVSRFKQAYHAFSKTGEWHPNYQVLTAGWQKFDGVLLMTPHDTFDTDYQVYLTAITERSLRELLLAFPRRCSGMFHLTEEWMDNGIHDVLEGEFVHTDDGRFYRGIKRGSGAVVEQRTISKRKDAVAAEMRKLATLKGKLEYSQFVVEGDLMVERAVRDGFPIERLLYTTALFETSEGQNLLKRAAADNISCYQVNDGVMGSVSTTRPVPSVMASVYFNFRHFLSESGKPNFHFSPGCTILIAENIANPDNLGMTLRTADAVGVSAVLLSSIGASPFHKNCVRASRGAVGRLPLYDATDIGAAIEALRLSGWSVLGGTSSAEKELYATKFSLPAAIVVGNENTGLSAETRAACTELVRIPMASGQSSLNVGVAAGVLLYELARQCRI